MGSMLNIPSRMEGPEQKTIIGKPEITVSAKGIVNGTSVYLNDGADFGPDTKLGTTTPEQYGPPYTATSGIQEALNTKKNVRLIDGQFNVSSPSIMSTYGQKLIGSSHGIGGGNPAGGSVINVTASNIDAIQIDGSAGDLGELEIGDFLILFDVSSSGHAINCINPVANESLFVKSYIRRISVHNCSTTAFNFTNFFNSVFESLNTYDCNGILDISSYGDGQDVAGNSTFIDIKDFGSSLTQTNSNITINGSASSTNGGGVQQIAFIRPEIEVYSAVPALNINNANNISFSVMDFDQYTTALPTNIIELSTAYNISFYDLMFGMNANLSTNMEFTNCGEIWFYNPIIIGAGSTLTISGSGVNDGGVKWLGSVNQSVRSNGGSLSIVNSSASYLLDFYPPLVEKTVNGITAGTVYVNLVSQQPQYKKKVIIFNGYENDTTTNQVIDFIIGFNTIASITSNTTGLTIATSVSGITITAPDNTTTYSGIVVVEGY